MSTRFNKHCLSLMISSLLLFPAVKGHTAETTLISVDLAGRTGNGQSGHPSISANGRYVAFSSGATKLVAGDTNGVDDVFVHDRSTGVTTRVSVNSAGEQGNLYSFSPSISADGRYVAFPSSADNLVAGDTGREDIFVHDRTTGTTTRVSVNSAGQQANTPPIVHFFWLPPAISADGRFIAFLSDATNLVTGDTNGFIDTFVHDRITGTTTRISVNSEGQEANGDQLSYCPPAISADGRFVAFESASTNLVTGDTNGTSDVFVHDRSTGTTTRVSVNSAGEQGDNYSYFPAISADGRFVTFQSGSSNIVAGNATSYDGIFVHDRTTGTTTRVNVDSAGQQGPGRTGARLAAISADGRSVSFSSGDTLVTESPTRGAEVFAHDRYAGTTTIVSMDSAGLNGGNFSYSSAINADGRFVAFESWDPTLITEDRNREQDIFIRDRQLNTNRTADLQVAVTSQPTSVQTGKKATYVYTLTNNGPNSIDKGSKLIGVIANGGVISLTPSQGSCTKAAVFVCRFGELASGASATLTVVIKATSDPITQQISVNAPPVDNVPDNNSLTVSTPVTP